MGLRLQTSTQWGAIKKIIATQPGVRYRVKLGYVHGGSVGGGMEVYNGGVESTQSIGGSGWLNKTTERVFEFVADSDMVMLKFFSGEVSGVEVNLYLSKVEISIANSNHYSRIRGDKTYELSNHLGNVLATITDRKLGFSNNNSNNFATHYQAEVTSATDYYPFGSQMSDRSVSSDKARYGFQGQEKDSEMKGEGNSINYKYRMHDPRLGRFFSVDPLATKFPWNSSYAFSENSTIAFVELEGLEKVYFGNSKSTIDITLMNSDQLKILFESKGFNYDSDWFNPESKNREDEVWKVQNGSDEWGHSTGTFIAKFAHKNSYKGGSGKSFYKDVDRTFVQWLYAKDASMEGPKGMKNGLSFGVGVAGLVISGGSLYLLEAGFTFYQGATLALSIDGLTNINEENTLLESVVEKFGGEKSLKVFKGAKLTVSVKDGLKSLTNITINFADGKKFEGVWDAANQVFTSYSAIKDVGDAAGDNKNKPNGENKK